MLFRCSIQLINKHFLRSLITCRHQQGRQISDNITSSAACRTPTILFSQWHSSHGKLLISPMAVRSRRGSECGGGSSEVGCGVAWFFHDTLIKQMMVFRGGVARICIASHPVCCSDVYNANVTMSCQSRSEIGEKYHPNRRPFHTQIY